MRISFFMYNFNCKITKLSKKMLNNRITLVFTNNIRYTTDVQWRSTRNACGSEETKIQGENENPCERAIPVGAPSSLTRSGNNKTSKKHSLSILCSTQNQWDRIDQCIRVRLLQHNLFGRIYNRVFTSTKPLWSLACSVSMLLHNHCDIIQLCLYLNMCDTLW